MGNLHSRNRDREKNRNMVKIGRQRGKDVSPKTKARQPGSVRIAGFQKWKPPRVEAVDAVVPLETFRQLPDLHESVIIAKGGHLC